MRGLFRLFSFCAPRVCTGLRDRDYGAFSRFCMLLLKASCCISFCLRLPTCKLGLIPPTSLTSPSSSTQLGQGAIASHSAPLGSGRSLAANLPLPCPCHPLPTPKTLDGVEFEHSGVLCRPACAQRCPALHNFEFRSRVAGQQSGQARAGAEPNLGVSPRGPGLQAPRGVGRPIAGPSLGPRWLCSDRSLLVIWGLKTGTQFLGETVLT